MKTLSLDLMFSLHAVPPPFWHRMFRCRVAGSCPLRTELGTPCLGPLVERGFLVDLWRWGVRCVYSRQLTTFFHQAVVVCYGCLISVITREGTTISTVTGELMKDGLSARILCSVQRLKPTRNLWAASHAMMLWRKWSISVPGQPNLWAVA